MRRKSMLAFACGICCVLGSVCLGASSALSPKDQEILERVTVAWHQGDPRTALELLSPLVNRLSGDQVAAADTLLAERSVPGVGQILSDARRAFVQQGFGDALPKATLPEAARVLPILAAEVEAVSQSAQKTRLFEDPLPILSGIAEYEDALWDSHVLSNRLENVRALAAYAAHMAKTLSRTQVSVAPAEQRDVLERDYNKLVARLDKQLQELAERTIELRIWRLQLARELLSQPALSKEKFLAAHASQLDGRVVSEFFQERKAARTPFLRPDLAEPVVSRWVAEDAKECSRLAGELQIKAQMLFEGLHWWLRGRYGMGPEVFGLAKSPAAMVSPAAQFGLYMPAAIPTPTDPASREQAIPTFDRRHHYWWAWEDRQVMRRSFTARSTETEVTRTGQWARETYKTSQFW